MRSTDMGEDMVVKGKEGCPLPDSFVVYRKCDFHGDGRVCLVQSIYDLLPTRSFDHPVSYARRLLVRSPFVGGPFGLVVAENGNWIVR